MEELEKVGHEWSPKASGNISTLCISSSLLLSLLSGTGAIVCKSWLAYNERRCQIGTLYQRAVILQRSMDSFRAYSLGAFTFSLLSLIELALFFFLLGFIVYLNDLVGYLATFVSGIAGLALFIYTYTVVLGALYPGCPYKTPYSMFLRKNLLLFQSLTKYFSRSPQRIPRTGSLSERGISEKREDYARSVGWILEQTSHQGASMEAARGILTLQDTQSIRIVFRGSSGELVNRYVVKTALFISGFYGMPQALWPIPDDDLVASPVYGRLLSLFQESLSRYLYQQSSQGASKDLVDEVTVYGRAICHALINSHVDKEAFGDLSKRLGDLTSLARMREIVGELRLLVMCTSNTPGFWVYQDYLDNSLNAIDVSILPMYIASISIASLSGATSQRGLWVNRLVHLSLSRDDPSPRAIGVAANALAHITQDDIETMLADFREVYPRGDKYILYVLKALQLYTSYPESIPGCTEAYAALVKAFRIANRDLHETRDDICPPSTQAWKEDHRADLRNLGSEILDALETILISVSKHIKPGTLEVDAPVHEALSMPTDRRQFIEEILLAVEDGVGDYRWGEDVRPSQTALWRTAEVVESNSESLRILLELMCKANEKSEYSSLFREHPPVASVITTALNSNVAQIRTNALLLICRNARDWFEDPLINESFLTSKLDEYLIHHLQFSDASHHTIRSLVTHLESNLEWRKRLHRGFHGLALSSSLDVDEGGSASLMELSLDVWKRLSTLPSIPEMEATAIDYNWYSDDMVSKVTAYVVHRVEAYQVDGLHQTVPTGSVETSGSLRAYVTYIGDMQVTPQSSAVQGLLQAFRQLEELIAPSSTTME
ncbi:hypothetical protein FRC03_005323 [Tulasnella sp. 419]|nr:hypothetical protein FRC03_005323 [Tulasnella sp. 419]